MLESQRKKLTEHTGKYLSIGITVDGAPRRSVWVTTTPQIARLAVQLG